MHQSFLPCPRKGNGWPNKEKKPFPEFQKEQGGKPLHNPPPPTKTKAQDEKLKADEDDKSALLSLLKRKSAGGGPQPKRKALRVISKTWETMLGVAEGLAELEEVLKEEG